MKRALAPVPAPVEAPKPKRRSRLTQADRDLARALRVVMREYADGPVTIRRRAELKSIASMALSAYFAAKVAGR